MQVLEQYICCTVRCLFVLLLLLSQALNLIKAGYNVVVWNRSADKCEPLKAAGATVSPAAAAAAAAAA
jgi:hypothetical protein